MKNHVLYNPLAGHGKSKDYLETLSSKLNGEVIIQNITEISDYEAFVASLAEEDVITLCGGDGTINRFINSVDTDNLKNSVYCYGAGSGNDFLYDIAKDEMDGVIEISKYLKNLPTVEIDGKVYKFINGIGFGIDGYCCEVGDQKKAKSDKPVNYTMIAISGLLFHFKPRNATVIVDGKEYTYKKVWIAPTMNGRCYGGGMVPTPNQDRLNSERTVSSMVFHGTNKLKTLMIFPSIFKGEHIKHTEAIDIHEGKEITVKFDRPTPLQIDGETVLGVTEYKVHAGVSANVK
ncbi:MAG: diacylglycerol kinase family protein [Ruminococcaceae bacterium]|nr:diacylglycerol kinase family protein [Oscillospiraceae bacterium]